MSDNETDKSENENKWEADLNGDGLEGDRLEGDGLEERQEENGLEEGKGEDK